MAVFIRFWYTAGGILVLFWWHLGVILAPWALPGDPRKRHSEKIMKKSDFGHLLVARRGAFGKQFSTVFMFLAMSFQVIFLTRFLEGFWSLWGPPPTMKMMVSCTRNHCFYIPTCTPKVTGNCFQWLPFWHPLGSKIQKKEIQKTCKKRVSKKVWKKSREPCKITRVTTLLLP